MASMRLSPFVRGPLAGLVIVLLGAGVAAAQGRGRGLTKNGTNLPANPTSSTAGSTPVGFRQFGSWLDDASLVDPGTMWTALSFGHYRSRGGSQNDFPVVDASVGLSRRVQFGITVPHYSMNFLDGTNVGGLGDVYASVKTPLGTVGHGANTVRFAATPILEVTQTPVPGTGRFSWGVPVNVEFHPGKYRVFGSTGFFSRGAVFGSGALEVPVHKSVLVTGSLSYTRSVKDDTGADALGLAKNRSDVSVVAAYMLSPAIAVFGGTGRTLSNADGSGTSFMLTGGMSFTLAPHAPHHP